MNDVTMDIYVGDELHDIRSNVTGVVTDLYLSPNEDSLIKLCWNKDTPDEVTFTMKFEEIIEKIENGIINVIPTSEFRLMELNLTPVSAQTAIMEPVKDKAVAAIEHLEKIHHHLGEYIKSVKGL